MEISLGTVTWKEILEILVFVFFVGGAWRDFRILKKILLEHVRVGQSERETLIELITQHNENHGACIKLPRPGNSR